jgi:hypothetical protein
MGSRFEAGSSDASVGNGASAGAHKSKRIGRSSRWHPDDRALVLPKKI